MAPTLKRNICEGGLGLSGTVKGYLSITQKVMALAGAAMARMVVSTIRYCRDGLPHCRKEEAVEFESAGTKG